MTVCEKGKKVTQLVYASLWYLPQSSFGYAVSQRLFSPDHMRQTALAETLLVCTMCVCWGGGGRVVKITSR